MPTPPPEGEEFLTFDQLLLTPEEHQYMEEFFASIFEVIDYGE